MSKEQMVKCFNEWMRRMIEAPGQFQEEIAIMRRFLDEQLVGEAPSYGRECAAIMFKIAEEIGA